MLNIKNLDTEIRDKLVDLCDRGFFINIYKPDICSSFKIVSVIKNSLRKYDLKYKIGHGGTLDPKAEGILPIAAGKATRLLEFLINKDKTYRFKIQFGKAKDTGDREGITISKTDKKITKENLKEILSNFIGKISQTPHKYSAIKINGQKSYDLARQGKKVEIKSREIKISYLRLLHFDYQTQIAELETLCSKGTYIRSLAEDIALSLQNYGYVLELCRISLSVFSSSNLLYLHKKHIEQGYVDVKLLFDHAISMNDILVDIPVIYIENEDKQKISYGQKIKLSDKQLKIFSEVNNVDFSSDLSNVQVKFNDKLVAIASLLKEKSRYYLKAKKVFC